MDDLVIREYRESDIPQILQVIKTAFREQRGVVHPPSSAESKTLEILKNELERADALVVEAKGKIIASVCFRPLDGEIYVDRLAVLPEYRNRGIASDLMQEIESRVPGMGFSSIALAVRLELESQQDYYKRRGYKITSYRSHKGFSDPTYVVMKKQVS